MVSNVRAEIHFVKQEPLTSTFKGFLLMTMGFFKASAQSTTVELQRIDDDQYKTLSHSNPLLKSIHSVFSMLDHCMLLPITAFFIIYLFIVRPPVYLISSDVPSISYNRSSSPKLCVCA